MNLLRFGFLFVFENSIDVFWSHKNILTHFIQPDIYFISTIAIDPPASMPTPTRPVPTPPVPDPPVPTPPVPTPPASNPRVKRTGFVGRKVFSNVLKELFPSIDNDPPGSSSEAKAEAEDDEAKANVEEEEEEERPHKQKRRRSPTKDEKSPGVDDMTVDNDL